MKFKIYLLISVALLQHGCATIISGTTQNINVKVIDSITNNPLDGCQCIVTDGSGSQRPLIGNPASLRISKGRDMVEINCSKSGYTQLNTSVGNSFEATTLVNILFWPGVFVDLITGAYKKVPSHYVVSMKKI
jgi:hypothetical protein